MVTITLLDGLVKSQLLVYSIYHVSQWYNEGSSMQYKIKKRKFQLSVTVTGALKIWSQNMDGRVLPR